MQKFGCEGGWLVSFNQRFCFLSLEKWSHLRRPLAGITAKSPSPRALSPAVAQSLHIAWASSKPQGLNKKYLSTKLQAALFLIESNYDFVLCNYFKKPNVIWRLRFWSEPCSLALAPLLHQGLGFSACSCWGWFTELRLWLVINKSSYIVVMNTC